MGTRVVRTKDPGGWSRGDRKIRSSSDSRRRAIRVRFRRGRIESVSGERNGAKRASPGRREKGEQSRADRRIVPLTSRIGKNPGGHICDVGIKGGESRVGGSGIVAPDEAEKIRYGPRSYQRMRRNVGLKVGEFVPGVKLRGKQEGQTLRDTLKEASFPLPKDET
jgi:hypothetical protein